MSTLSVVIDASTRGTGAFAQMATSLAGVKAAADATNTSLDDTKVKTESTSSSMGLLSKANIDLATRFKDTRTQVDNVRQALVAHGVASRDAETATKGLFDQLARKGVLSDLKSAFSDAGVSVRGMGSQLSVMATELVNAQQQAENSTPFFSGLGSTLSSVGDAAGTVGGSIMPILIGSLVSAAVATTPMIVAFTGWLVVTTGLTVGLAGLAATVAVFLGGIGLLMGGMVALTLATQGWSGSAQSVSSAQSKVASATSANTSAQQALERAQLAVNSATKPTASQLLTLQQAQDKAATSAQNLKDAQNALADAEKNQNNPLQTMESTWGKVATTLGAAATPAVAAMFAALDQLAPTVQALALAWIQWYNSISPTVLGIFTGLAQGFLGVAQQLTPQIQGLVNAFLQMWPSIQVIVTAFGQLGAVTVVTLLTHLLQLSQWFLQTWPQAAAVSGAGFNILGSAIRGILNVGAQMVTFFVSNWPTISALARDSANAFGYFGQYLQVVWAFMQGPLHAVLVDIITHQQEFTMVLLAMLGPIMGVIAILAVLVVAFAGLIAITIQTTVWMEQLEHWFQAQLPAAITTLGDYFSQLGANAHSVWSQLTNEIETDASNIGGFFSNVGSAANSLKDAFGSAFSAIGSSVHGAFSDVANIIVSFDKAADNLPVLGGMLNLPQSFPGFAEGGIVNRPTLGVFGEAGPEALIPLGGGPGNANALNLWAQAGQALGVHGLGAGPNMTPGTWGGQCVVFVEAVTGVHYPVAFAAQMASYVNSPTPAPGEVFVSTIPPYGHTGIVLSGNQVIDSNWGLNELIQIHSLSDIPDIVGYISGVPMSGLPAGSTLDVSSAMTGLVSRALGGAGGLVGSIANGMLNLIISGAKSKFGAGGLGAGLGGGRSSAPSMPSAPRGGGRGAGMGNDRVEALLASIDRKLATIAGAPSVGGLAAAQRIG